MDEATQTKANLLYLYFLDMIVDGNEEEYPVARSLFANPEKFYEVFFDSEGEKSVFSNMPRAHTRFNLDDS